jgi:hypothetical protein
MFDIFTILIAVWFAIITLIIAEILKEIPFPRIRIILPLVCGVLLGFFILIHNPELDSGYRGQMNYLGPFCFPVLVPLLASVPLVFFGQRGGNILGKPAEFSGAFFSAFLFLTLYQSRIFFHSYQGILASSLLIGSALIVSTIVFFIIERAKPVLSGLHDDDKQVNQDQQSGKKSPRFDMKMIVLLSICLLLFLSPLFFIDFFDRLDRSTMGQLDLYLLDPSETTNGTFIHMTEEKMREYPELLTLIQKPRMKESDGSVRLEKKDINGSSLGIVRISCKTESRMHDDGLVKGLWSSSFFEYNGYLYSVVIMHYAGEECVRLSLFS